MENRRGHGGFCISALILKGVFSETAAVTAVLILVEYRQIRRCVIRPIGPGHGDSESASPLQAFSDGLLEHGLVADPSLFGDLPRLFEVGDRDAN